jgi:hypothetical protein
MGEYKETKTTGEHKKTKKKKKKKKKMAQHKGTKQNGRAQETK